MADEYTPTTDEVREQIDHGFFYRVGYGNWHLSVYDFDRWLAAERQRASDASPAWDLGGVHYARIREESFAYGRNECHCGEPIVMDLYDSKTGYSSRGLCRDCSAVRCDAYPGACRTGFQGGE